MVHIFRRRVGGSSTYTTTNVINKGSSISTAQLTNPFLRRDGKNSATADISFNSHKLTNLLTPTADYDARTKLFLDTRAKSLQQIFRSLQQQTHQHMIGLISILFHQAFLNQILIHYLQDFMRVIQITYQLQDLGYYLLQTKDI